MIRVRRFSTLLALVLGLGTAVAAQRQPTVLTNTDIIKMVQAQLSPSVIAATIDSSDLNFDLSPDGLIALKKSGVPDQLIQFMQTKMTARNTGTAPAGVSRTAPEKSDTLANSKDPAYILRNFKTMLVIATNAKFFGTEDMKAALGNNKDFRERQVSIVADGAVADTVLEVSYTFAWDYPFTLKHQNTSIVLVSGKGSGPFSGPAGAADVARELAKMLKPYRSDEGKKK